MVALSLGSLALIEGFVTYFCFCFPTVEKWGGFSINSLIQCSNRAIARLRSRLVLPSNQIRQPSNVMFVSCSISVLVPLVSLLIPQVSLHTKSDSWSVGL